MLKIITCKNPDADVFHRYMALQREYNLPSGDRKSDHNVLVVTKEGLAFKQGSRLLKWHPGLLHTLRESGERHPWVKLGNIQQGDKVLDCTLGLGTDAQFISEITQEVVIGLESSLGVYLLSREGLSKVRALVKPVFINSLSFLLAQQDNAFDVVIADPMFPPHLIKSNTSLDMVRALANFESISDTWLIEARRVAKRCVLIKDHRANDLLENLKADFIWSKGKRNNRYGRWKAAGVS